jgi:hypothetical protein
MSEGLNVEDRRMEELRKKEIAVKGKRVQKLLKIGGIAWRRCAKECVIA